MGKNEAITLEVRPLGFDLNYVKNLLREHMKKLNLVVIGTRFGCLGIILVAIIWTALLVKLFISLI